MNRIQIRTWAFWPLVIAMMLTSGIAGAQSPVPPAPIGVNDVVSIDSIPAQPTYVASSSEVQPAVDSISAESMLGDTSSIEGLFSNQTDSLTSPESLPSSIKLAVVLGVLSLAPAIILMSTCYVRVIVVLTLLRQAFGVQQLPPTQVLTALSLFVTLHVPSNRSRGTKHWIAALLR